MPLLVMKVHTLDMILLPIHAFDKGTRWRSAKTLALGIHMHENVVRATMPNYFGGGKAGNPLGTLVPILDGASRVGEVDAIGNIVQHGAQHVRIFKILIYSNSGTHGVYILALSVGSWFYAENFQFRQSLSKSEV